jgi:hypothetical protein
MSTSREPASRRQQGLLLQRQSGRKLLHRAGNLAFDFGVRPAVTGRVLVVQVAPH